MKSASPNNDPDHITKGNIFDDPGSVPGETREGKIKSTPLTLSPREHVISVGSAEPAAANDALGVTLYKFASEACGATAFSTGLGVFKTGALLPFHSYPVSEAVTVVNGTARLIVQDRAYQLGTLDCVHIPAGVAHTVQNVSSCDLITHSAFGSANPARELLAQDFQVEERGLGDPHPGDPETIIRFTTSPVYELSKNAFFTDLFARRLGSVGICGGYGRFLPGASLPCHIHDYDESITIVKGAATCLVEGRRYELSDCATAFVPRGFPHRFVNTSTEEMAMIWVYAGDEPDRRIVDNEYCSGLRTWPGADAVDSKEG